MGMESDKFGRNLCGILVVYFFCYSLKAKVLLEFIEVLEARKDDLLGGLLDLAG